MKEKYLWAAIVILIALLLGLTGYIYEQGYDAGETPAPAQKAGSGKAPVGQWEEEQWRKKVHDLIRSGAPITDPDFDAFFDDSFFGRRYDPFSEMERIYRRMMDALKGHEQVLFDDPWNKWYGRRMLMGEFKTGITRTDKDVALTIQLPGQAAKTADINITDDRIKISFTAKTAVEEKTAGGVLKKESAQSYIKVLPLPDDVLPGTGKASIDGGTVKIKFDRRAAGR